MKFCGMCGTHLAQGCQSCGFVNPQGYRYCGTCGAQLSGEAVTPVGPLQQSMTQLLQPQVAVKTEELSVQPGPAAIQLEGERRIVTVVLTDLTGSTELLERVGSEAWVELMNRVLHILESEVYRFGGEVDQFRGDGLVAFFGASSAHEDDPERAVLAALSMQQAIKLYASELVQREGIDLRMRVGVNTGEVIIASVGNSRQHSEDTAMGMAVAVAARMETAAEPGAILVSENTYRLVESQFEWQPLGEITVKGMSRPIPVYRPLAPKSDEDQEHLQAFEFSVPLIGRDTEFHTLKRCVEDLSNGHGRIVMLVGDNGMGKSFLVNEAHQYFTRLGALLAESHAETSSSAPPLTWLRGRCRSYDQSWPYSVWQDLLRGWLGMRQDESKEETRNRLRSQAEALWGDNLAEYYPSLAAFLSLPLEEAYSEKIRHLDAVGLRQRFFLTIRSWVEAMAGRGPVVLNFSDLQWSDTSSLELLKHCLPLCDHEALLCILVFRPDRTSPVWKFRRHVETSLPHQLTLITLSPFTPDQSNEFMDWLVGPEGLPEETRALIIKNSEGNPYYILEIIQSLIAREGLVRDSETNQWRMTRSITTLDLPDNLQRLLLARIDRLSPEEKDVLQIAAVIGPVFWFNVLQALANDAHALKADLSALQRAQLIYEDVRMAELGMQYLFKTPLIRDAAYESLLSAPRAAYHLKVAEYLESLSNPEVLVEYFGILAHHYRGARQSKKELFYTLQAAEQSERIYANAEALDRYTRALELLDEMEAQAANEAQLYAIHAQRSEVLNKRSQVHYLLGNIQGGEADARDLLPLAKQLSDDPVWLIDALLKQPEVNSPETHEDLIAGMPMAQQALSLAQQSGDQHREMRSLISIANLRSFLRDSTWHEFSERALELARQLGDQKTEVDLLLGIGSAFGMDDLKRSKEYLEAALSICHKLDDKSTEMRLLSALGAQYERSGDYYRLLTEYEQKRLHISREIGNRLAEGEALMYCAQIQGLYLGDYEGGMALAQESLHLWESSTVSLFPLLRIAQIQVAQGKFDQAMATLEHARPLGEQNVYDLGRAGLDLVSAILYNAMGDKTSLRLVLELTVKIHQMVADNLVSRQYQMAAACESAAAYLGLARRLTDEAECRSHLHQALQSSRTALDIYQQFGFVQIIECVSEEIFFRHSQALAANGYQSEADKYLKQADEEMTRKHVLIPIDSSFRNTYLENIQLHRAIRDANRMILDKPHGFSAQ